MDSRSRGFRFGVLKRGFLVAAIGLSLSCTPPVAGEDVSVGFLVSRASVDELGAEGKAAFLLADKLTAAALVTVDDGGVFAGRDGGEMSLDRFDVLWIHQGDSTDLGGPIHDPATIEELAKYVSHGGGLFLSGAALAMLHALGVEPTVTRLGGPGKDANPAAAVPVVQSHPVFKGMGSEGRPIRISDAGFPAFSDFHASGGPVGGMLLARTPGGSENPLVEYELGSGRIVAMGWRLPHYSHAANPFGANLQRLTGNILHYLSDEALWRRVVIRPVPGAKPANTRPGIADHRWRSLKLAVNDLIDTHDARYAEGRGCLKRLAELKETHDRLLGNAEKLDAQRKATLDAVVDQFNQLHDRALLANPLLDFDRLLLVKRGANKLGLPTNWQSNSSLPMTGYANEIGQLSPVRPGGEVTTLYRPEGGRFVGDVDVHFDGDRMLFSMPGANGRWQVFEINGDGSDLRELPLIHQPDVDNYDACYLPDGRIIFSSTAPFVGVPCVRGSSHVTNLYVLNADGSIRQLTVDQEHNWCPTVLNNGRVLYLRWEYSDTPHAFCRILFHMNPDGTEQMEYYGSNSYWPNAMFYARPVPGHPTKVAVVVGGHHDNPRMGELVVFDPALGRHEADGAVQRIPGHGEPVEPILLDGLTKESWPKFLHPYPLSDKYFLVSCRPHQGALWGIYLVDTFDNFVLLAQQPGWAMLEPIPLKAMPTPPALPDRVNLQRKDATVLMADVYAGGGLKGVTHGTVKRLRLIGYHYAYHGMGGQVDRVGLDGPWDVKTIIGTVPVEEDGSAKFRVPAYTPIAVQPLDGEGKAVQLMRSWFTAMPGETLSCVGCHDRQNSSPPAGARIASGKPPSEIEPWYGPARGYSFRREVQPVLDEYCVGCHHGRPRNDGPAIADLTDRPDINMRGRSETYNQGAHFPPSYFELRCFVRSATIESDLHMLPPREFHADTTKLVQMLEKGHYGVTLDEEGWDRIITWIDLQTPAHGNWTDVCGPNRVDELRDRRREMRRLYTGLDEDPEIVDNPYSRSVEPVMPPETVDADPPKPDCPGWPFDGKEARRRQADVAGGRTSLAVDLGQGVTLEMVRIPDGSFIMGDATGYADERPVARVEIERPFWMGRLEVTNRQFARFDPAHDSRLEHGDFLQFSHLERGYPVNGPEQPVVRVSWNRAMEFCEWLSATTGRHFTLPSEAQWEYACRAGTDAPLWYGSLDDDFSPFANLSDATNRSVDTLGWSLPSGAIPPWRPADERFNDGFRVSAPVGSFSANAWGLCDMHGNAAEWTRSKKRGHSALLGEKSRMSPFSGSGQEVVRGGSWYDRPIRCRSAMRLSYSADQGVYDVGFRVVCETDEDPQVVRAPQ